MKQTALIALVLLLDVAPALATAQAPAEVHRTSAAAVAPVRDLVTAQVDMTRTSALSNHRASWAAQGNDAGFVPDNVRLDHLSIELNRTPEREQAFQQLLRDQQDPASREFRRWLTPAEVGERYGASSHDIDAVTRWLSAQGMTGIAVSNSRTRITFDASAAAVANTFGTRLRYYDLGTERRIAGGEEPRVPTALAALVQSVRGLASERRYPQHTNRSAMFRRDAVTSRPEFSNCSGGACDYAIFPSDFATIYNTKAVAAGTNGNGQKIAIVGKSRVNNADLQAFMQLSNISFALPTVTIPPGGVDPGPAATTCTTTGTNTCSNPSDQVSNQSEATLDVERAGSVATGATLQLVVSKDTSTADGTDIAEEYIIDTNPPPAKILSISFGSCEADNGSAVAHAEDGLFQQAAAEGISVFVSSGDSGAAECSPPFQTPPAVQKLSINVLCSSGSVTCVGGTEFNDSANPAQYWSTTNGTGFESAIGYIPEGAWNDPLDDNGHPQPAATGGGVSAFIATPSWQTGPGVPGTQGRYTPDVSLHASTNEGYFFCIAAEGESCVADSQGSITFGVGGGTSASTPSMAGIAALLNQKVGSAQGNLNPRLYALGANSSAAAFHDVTVASSGVSGCSTSTPSRCNNSTPGTSGLSGGQRGYAVGSGYDQATGWGSINAANLLANWSTSTNSSPKFGSGNVSYAFNVANGTVQLHADSITNPGTTTSAPLRIELWAFSTPFTGSQTGYTLATSASLGTLGAGQSLSNTTVTLPFTSPPNGTYYLTLFLEEQNCSTGYCYVDYSNFATTRSFPLSTSAINLGGYMSGNWYDSSQGGHGFQLELTSVNHGMLAIWFVYTPNGSGQNWIYAQGSFDPSSNSVTLPAILLTGAKFPPQFNSGDVHQTSWGTLTFTFTDCNNGTASWNSTVAGYGSGSLPITRLTQIEGTVCP
jgi:subtilase family serine protease